MTVPIKDKWFYVSDGCMGDSRIYRFNDYEEEIDKGLESHIRRSERAKLYALLEENRVSLDWAIKQLENDINKNNNPAHNICNIAAHCRYVICTLVTELRPTEIK